MSETLSSGTRNRTLKSLRLLLVEDSENDAMLLLRELRRGGYDPIYERVDTPEDMETALREADRREEPYEIVISDYYMPRFKGPEALALLKELGYELPFIVVSGKVGEELAVEMMQAGAQDYITKENMARLNPAVERELREAEVRRQRRRAEEAFRRSENRFRRLVEQATDAIFVHDLEGRFVDVNLQACESLGYTREELLGLSVTDVEVNYDPESVAKLWREISRGSPRTVDGVHRRKDGTTFPVEVRLGLFESEGESLLMASVRDITERRKAEAELRESEERFRATFEQAAVGIVQVDLDGEWVRVNDRFCEITGYTREELQQASVFGLISTEDYEADYDRGVRMLDGELREYTEEKRIVGKGGREVWINLTVSLVHDDSDEPRYFIAVVEDIRKRKQAEEELRLRDRAITASPDGIVITDPNQPDNPVIYVNPSFELITGYTAQEIVGRNCRFLQGDDRDQPALEGLRQAISEKRYCSVVLRNYRKDGTLFWNELSLSPVWDDNGNLTHFIGVQEDVTDRKQAEDALRESEERFRALTTNASDMVLIVEADGTIRYESPAVERILGYKPEERVGNKAFDLIHPDDVEHVMRAFVEYLEEPGVNSPVEYRTLAKDGTWHYFEAVGNNLLHDPVIHGIVVNARDVTQRKQIEAGLKESEERFRATFAQAAVGLAHTGFEGEWLRVNDRLCEIVGYSREELLAGMTFQDITHPDDLQDDLDFFVRLMAGEIPSYSIEKRYLRKDGSVVWIALSVSTANDEEGNPEYCIAVVEDITERKRDEAELERQAELIDLSYDAVMVLDSDGIITYWNRGAEEIYGWSREEAVGEIAAELLQTRFPSSPEDVEATLRLAGRWEGELLHTRRDGKRVQIESRMAVVDGDGSRTFMEINRDVTERKRNEEELVRLASFPRLNPNPIIETSVAGRITYLNPAAEAWFPDLADQAGSHPILADLETVEAEIEHSEERLLNREIRVGDNFYLQTVSRLPESGLLRTYITDTTERRRAEDGLRFLAEASATLSSSLDYHATLAGVAELAVPGIADWCAVDIVEDDGSLERLAVVHEDPEKVELVRELQERYPPDSEEQPHGLPQVLHTRQPILVPEMTDAHLEEFSQDEEHWELLRGLGLRSYMTVPLVARDRMLGAITLVSAESGRRYSDTDLKLAEDLARRVAVAVDNARLYEEAQWEISEREEAEVALRASQERYQTFIAQSTEGILRFELEEPISTDRSVEEQIEHFYRYAYLAECNDTLARLYGFSSAEEVIGARLDDMWPRSVPENVEFLRAGVRSGYKVEEVESQEFDRWGTPKYFLNNLTGIIEDGYVVRAWGTQRDITQQKRIQDALRQSEELYRTVVEQAAENIFLVDVETKRILECNEAFCSSLGYEEKEVEEMTLYDVVARDRQSIDQNILRILEKGAYFVGERQYRRKDGSLVDVEVNVSMVELEGGPAMCVVAHDVTERKRAEEALEGVREAERNRIARDLHDDILQNIVYALQEAQIMQVVSEDGGGSELESIADALRRSVEGLRGAIFELRLEGTLSQSFLSSLQALIETNRRMSRHQYDLALSVGSGFPEDVPETEGRQVIRIIQEALNNVRKHAEARHVTVELGGEEELIWGEIVDDGKGFDAGTYSGGVGQDSMRQRAEEIGGRLTVESAPGAGSTVRFEIPRSRLIHE